MKFSKAYEKGKVKFLSLPTSPIILAIVLFILQSCSTGVPTLNKPPSSTNTLLSISVFFRDNITPIITYNYNGQDYTYYFYTCLFMRFDNQLLSNNLDLTRHIMFFERGFKRINRIREPSPNTSTSEEWSSIIIDNNSQLINNELKFNLQIPDNILGNINFIKFIVLVFLRDFEYLQIDDNFGQNVIHYFNNPSYSINIDITNIQPNTINVINNPNTNIEEANLPPGFPSQRENLKIEKIEYILRNF